MKKIIFSIMMVLALASTACGAKAPTTTTDKFNYKVGTASYTHTNDSYGYTEGKNGRGAVSTTLVAAVFDADGKIVRVSIDEVESHIGIDGTGQLADFTAGEVRSKKELGDSYGMKAYSGIGKEWYQQVESLEKWLEGKKVATVFSGVTAKMFDANSGYNMGYATSDGMNYSDSMATRKGDSSSQGIVGEAVDGINSAIDDMTDGTGYNNTGTAQGGWMDADLKASVTINTSYMEKAIEKAWRNAK